MTPQPLDEVLQLVRKALQELEYGTVTITVHDGGVVQIEKTEKLRVTARRPR